MFVKKKGEGNHFNRENFACLIINNCYYTSLNVSINAVLRSTQGTCTMNQSCSYCGDCKSKLPDRINKAISFQPFVTSTSYPLVIIWLSATYSYREDAEQPAYVLLHQPKYQRSYVEK